jgi:hypothetical protein
MITAATIAAEVERVRDHALPGREVAEVDAVQWAAWRMMRAERRAVRDQRRRANRGAAAGAGWWLRRAAYSSNCAHTAVA